MASSRSAIGSATDTEPHNPHLASLDDLCEIVAPPPRLDRAQPVAQPAAWYFSLLLFFSLSHFFYFPWTCGVGNMWAVGFFNL